MSEERYFPVMQHPEIKLPWSLIAQHEAQARANHGQSLEKLAHRGGLACDEAAAVLEDRKWSKIIWPLGAMRTDDPAPHYLRLLIERLLPKPVTPTVWKYGRVPDNRLRLESPLLVIRPVSKALAPVEESYVEEVRPFEMNLYPTRMDHCVTHDDAVTDYSAWCEVPR